MYRLECLGLENLWESGCPRVTGWYRRLKARPSMEQAVGPYLNETQLAMIRAEGQRAFLSDNSSPNICPDRKFHGSHTSVEGAG